MEQAVDKVNSRTQQVSDFDYETDTGPFPDIPDIYMDDISLPPPTGLHIFQEDDCISSSQLLPSSPQSKFPPLLFDDNIGIPLTCLQVPYQSLQLLILLIVLIVQCVETKHQERIPVQAATSMSMSSAGDLMVKVSEAACGAINVI